MRTRGRNTAPCIAYAAYTLMKANPDAEMIVTPSDHLILNEEDFRAIIAECLDFAAQHDAPDDRGHQAHPPGYGFTDISRSRTRSPSAR